jgi:2-(1,2-epoxy-1,2-dihydrophenyl)acetyl-CoA isomerase
MPICASRRANRRSDFVAARGDAQMPLPASPSVNFVARSFLRAHPQGHRHRGNVWPVMETVLYESVEGVATVTMNRPDRLNAIGEDMLERLLAAVERAASEDDVRVMILTGAGRGFCPGADMVSLAGDSAAPVPPQPVPFHTRVGGTRRWMRISELLWGMPKITIAAVNGACAGAGLSWAMACDLRFAARSAVFRTAFVGVGVSGDYGLAWSLPRVVGWGKARELMFLNARLSPEEAHALGMVAAVCPDEALMPDVHAVAHQLAAVQPVGLQGMKQNLLDAEALSLADELNLESDRLTRSLGTEASRAAARAFLSGNR